MTNHEFSELLESFKDQCKSLNELDQKIESMKPPFFSEKSVVDRKKEDLKKERKILATDIDHLFTRMYLMSNDKKIYWDFCSLKTYTHNLNERKQSFEKSFPDLEDKDFFEEELRLVDQCRVIEREFRTNLFVFRNNNHQWLNKTLSDDNLKRITSSQNAKTGYLLELLGFDKEINSDRFMYYDYGIDLSDKSINDRLTFLCKLGILEFLNEKYSIGSVHKLALLVSEISGIKKGTVQPAINAFLTNNPKAKAYPLSSRSLELFEDTMRRLKLS